MTVRLCLPWPDKRLRTAAAEVSEITDDIRAIWQDMVDTMDAMPGVGLAAPQIGVMLQLAVVDASDRRDRRILMANPSVLDASDEMNTHDEASPNLPGVSAKVKRPKTVVVRYMNEAGIITRRDFDGLEATSVQHQIDHLQGRMYFDNLGRVKRDMLLRKARKS
ncbi:Peptide deformylase 1 [Ascidiaceihabitans donghaensis]|uniref:Peptide deformylase-like n=1 Tax=Ascidiaceihabitans donghaensis TaxID=1510460 RepID=A0A2R8BHW1_9RHOB|nr:peptide deformylase [Ascidiaceihabitans donghaensis]SPH22610.1 Peptide deformylase 1 [Ascidiaceihabitans donghaensis]